MSGTRYSPLAALAASPARPRAYDVMPEALIPAGTATVQNQSAAFPLDPISETPLLRQAGVTQGEEQRMLDNAVTAAGFSGGIRAFHGSPHAFDRFDINRIGTGEGAQAYGRGLYFAEAEPVARTYRDALAQSGLRWNGENVGLGPFWHTGLPELRRQGLISERQHDGLLYASGANSLDRAVAVLRRQADHGNDLRGVPFSELADEVERLRGRLSIGPVGHMYEVDINADPRSLIDWDRPLNVQPQGVRDAAQRAWQEGEYSRRTGNPPLGSEGLGETSGGAVVRMMSETDPAEAAQRLRGAGVPGIRYLDQLSRDAGQGTSNYVVFDDSLIDILRRYGILGTLAGGGAAAGASQDGTQ